LHVRNVLHPTGKFFPAIIYTLFIICFGVFYANLFISLAFVVSLGENCTDGNKKKNQKNQTKYFHFNLLVY